MFEGAVFSFCRQLLALPRSGPQHVTREFVFSATGCPGPVAMLHIEKRRCVGQLVRSAPDAVWAAIQFDSPFLAAVQKAAAWFRDFLGRFLYRVY